MINPHTYRKRVVAAMMRGVPRHIMSDQARLAHSWLLQAEQQAEHAFGGRSIQTLWPSPAKLGRDAQGAWYGGVSPADFITSKKAWLLATLGGVE